MKEMGITRKKIRESSWNALVARKAEKNLTDWSSPGSKGHSFTELVVSVTWNQNKAALEVKDWTLFSCTSNPGRPSAEYWADFCYPNSATILFSQIYLFLGKECDAQRFDTQISFSNEQLQDYTQPLLPSSPCPADPLFCIFALPKSYTAGVNTAQMSTPVVRAGCSTCVFLLWRTLAGCFLCQRQSYLQKNSAK